MHADVFIDTNILVYAHDRDAGEKHVRARELIEGFWRDRAVPCLSVQVLQELHVNLVRKGVQSDTSAEIVKRYLSWRVLDNTRHLFQQALSVQQRWRTSFWDALIVAAAQRAGVSTLWSEDLGAGQDYGGVRVVNPLEPLVP
jgi:predicted nucleic acid-binding protein